MSVGGVFTGCLMLGMVRGTRRWSDEDQRLARVLGNIYASTLSRRRTEEELSETSRRLLEAQGGPVESGTTENLVEAALRTANRKLTLLSSITRHDILNQVSVLAGYLELTRMANRNPDLGQNLDRMEIAIKRVQESISFTKEYEQLGALGPSWQSLDRVVKNSIVGLELKGIEIVSDVTGFEVFADKMLDRVFMNLIDNSMRHGDGVKRIIVRSEVREEELDIIYQDDGSGISPDMRGKLFRRGAGRNTGFGLFLCKEILDLTRITISEIGEPGEGAKFLMRVPKGIYRFMK
jgi:signal transduction histidine kinase